MQGDCVRNCKRNAVVEGSSTGAAVAKRRRVVGFASPNVELENQRLCMDSGGMNAGDLCSSFCTDQFPSSCCSSNESSEVMRDNLRRLDLEVNFEFEFLNLEYGSIRFEFVSVTPRVVDEKTGERERELSFEPFFFCFFYQEK
jgi:hypothetical protein